MMGGSRSEPQGLQIRRHDDKKGGDNPAQSTYLEDVERLAEGGDIEALSNLPFEAHKRERAEAAANPSPA